MTSLVVQLLDYSYDQERHLINWQIVIAEGDEAGKQYTLSWLSEDLAAQFGIKSKNIPGEVILQFSEQMKNRTLPFRLEIHSTAKVRDKEWFKDASEKDLQKSHDELDRYPYYEVLSQMIDKKYEETNS
jgi:hypothetical protein